MTPATAHPGINLLLQRSDAMAEPVAVVEPDCAQDALQLLPGAGYEVALRIDLTPDGVQRLVDSGIRLVVVDLRQTCPSQIRPALRLLRLLVRQVRVVAVTCPGDQDAAQVCLASGALAHLGRGLSPLALIGALQSVQRGVPLLGDTAQRAVARMQPACAL